MTVRTAILAPVWAAVLTFALACGGGSKAADDTIVYDVPDVETISQDLPTAEEVTTEDLSPADEGVLTPDDGFEAQEEVAPVDVLEVELPEDAPVEASEVVADIEPLFCPAPAAAPGSEVCLLVGTVKTQYDSDWFAKCDQCADGPGCKGCRGTLTDCDGLPEPEYFTWRGTCDICPCRLEDECLARGIPETECGKKVCATKGAVQVEYPDLCAVKADFGCVDGYDDNLVGFGGCQKERCEDFCPDAAPNPLCGSDGETYDNKCSLINCPKTEGVTRKCLGACIGVPEFCPECPACTSEAEAVCGDDGITYATQCAATTCGTRDKLVEHVGPCCPECEDQPMIEVCAKDGKAYKNQCTASCWRAEPCGSAGPVVCGNDGQRYDNECWATCKAGGKLHEGECLRVCEQCPVDGPTDYSPVCGLDPAGKSRTYQSECFMTCQGGTGGTPGVCPACTELCQNATPAEVCGADGITYPNTCIPEKCMLLPAPKPGACVPLP